MTFTEWIVLIVYTAIVLALVKPFGSYMAAVYEGRRTFMHPVMRPVERGLYRVCGVDEEREQDWRGYALALLALGVLSFLILYLILRTQTWLPFNPQDLPNVKPSLAFNTSASFLTNTEWQAYGGETTLSYVSQTVGIVFQDFISPAVGMCVLVALIRALTRHQGKTIGNFWVDLVRGVLYILLPLAFVVAIFLVSQGVVQNWSGYKEVSTLEGAKQLFAMGPVASLESIKQIGTNGGGFMNVNSAHPFENPTAWSGWVEMVLILLMPAAAVYMYGKMVGSTKHGWVILGVMTVLYLAGTITAGYSEQIGNPLVADAGVARSAGNGQPGGNMEGKEVRNGNEISIIWGTAATAASNGSVDSMHDSWTPLAGLVPLANMQTDEVIFGGVGSGMYTMVAFILLSVFIAGLMIGRTPEYLGKKVEARETKAVVTIMLVLAILILFWTAVGAVYSFGTDTLNNGGPHGLSEILYAFSSATGNNGSAFAGLGANTTFYNMGGGIAILFGRYIVIIGMLVVAGTMVEKKRVAPGGGTLPVDGLVFGSLLAGVVVIVGLLTFFPVEALGPIAEHVLMHNGVLS